MLVSPVAVDGKHRHHGDDLQTLPQDIRQRNVVRRCIVGVEGQDASCEDIHHVTGRGGHDNVAHKILRKQRLVSGQNVMEPPKLVLIRQFAKEEQVRHLLIAVPAFGRKPPDKILDVPSSIIEMSRVRNFLPVHDLFCLHTGYLCQAGDDPLSVEIPEPGLDIILRIESRVDLIRPLTQSCQLHHLRRDFCVSFFICLVISHLTYLLCLVLTFWKKLIRKFVSPQLWRNEFSVNPSARLAPSKKHIL